MWQPFCYLYAKLTVCPVLQKVAKFAPDEESNVIGDKRCDFAVHVLSTFYFRRNNVYNNTVTYVRWINQVVVSTSYNEEREGFSKQGAVLEIQKTR